MRELLYLESAPVVSADFAVARVGLMDKMMPVTSGVRNGLPEP